jgi:hypothetical protein
MDQSATIGQRHEPWNKGKLVGQKSPLKLDAVCVVVPLVPVTVSDNA